MHILIIILFIFLIPFGILFLFLLFGLGISFYESIILIPKEFLKKKGVIVSVNGIKDNDTGLLSQGSISQTTLLFKDGEVITINKRIDSLILNKKCKLYFTKTKIFEVENFSRIVYDKKLGDKSDD